LQSPVALGILAVFDKKTLLYKGLARKSNGILTLTCDHQRHNITRDMTIRPNEDCPAAGRDSVNYCSFCTPCEVNSTLK
jgi:hypothetical protein